MNAPIFDRLTEYHAENRVSFAMPGHKNGRGLNRRLIDCDVTELDKTVDLFHDCDAVREANRLLSLAYGSGESRIVAEGSSSAIHAMIACSLKPGETLLADEKCHKSVVNTCALCGFDMRFFSAEEELEGLFKAFEDIKAVIITSPDYFGICRDIAAIAEICGRYGKILIVDEAHGAHFPASGKLPETAVRLGADLVCQSAHKTLNALTGAAFLHVNGGRINRSRLWQTLELFSSTSPSYVIAASADLARAMLTDTDSWDRLYKQCEAFKKAVRQKTDIKILKNDDFSRIVLDFSAYSLNGFEVSEELSQSYGIDVEMAFADGIVMIATPENTEDDLLKMLDAVCAVVKETGKTHIAIPSPPPLTSDRIKPYEAFYSEEEDIALENSSGRISKSTVTPYPPGVPVIMPGTVISADRIEYIKKLLESGAKITGIENGRIKCVGKHGV